MMFDVVLPSIITIIAAATVLLYAKVEKKIKSAFEEKEFGVRDIVFLVIGMGVMVTIIALVPLLIPQQAIRALFLVAYSFILFLFTYVVTEKWYFALLPSAVFVALYLSPYWNLLLLNIFAIIFAVLITVYLGSMFSWKTVIVFATLITVMDFIQVFGTGFMGASAENLLNLELPIMLIVPPFPVNTSGFLGLGLGDIFLTGLLAIQTAQKYGRNAGFISAVAVGFAFFVFEFIIFSYQYTGFFPATLVVMGGWLLGFGGNLLISRREQAS
jgi:presenilin-like A22 family membrane protease